MSTKKPLNVLTWNSNLNIFETLSRICCKTKDPNIYDVIMLQEISNFKIEETEDFSVPNITNVRISLTKCQDLVIPVNNNYLEFQNYVNQYNLENKQKNDLISNYNNYKQIYCFKIHIKFGDKMFIYKGYKDCWQPVYDCNKNYSNNCSHKNLVTLVRDSKDINVDDIYIYHVFETFMKGGYQPTENTTLVSSKYDVKRGKNTCVFKRYRHSLGIKINGINYVNMHNAHRKNAHFNLNGIIQKCIKSNNPFIIAGDMNIEFGKYIFINNNPNIRTLGTTCNTHSCGKRLDWMIINKNVFAFKNVESIEFHDSKQKYKCGDNIYLNKYKDHKAVFYSFDKKYEKAENKCDIKLSTCRTDIAIPEWYGGVLRLIEVNEIKFDKSEHRKILNFLKYISVCYDNMESVDINNCLKLAETNVDNEKVLAFIRKYYDPIIEMYFCYMNRSPCPFPFILNKYFRENYTDSLKTTRFQTEFMKGLNTRKSSRLKRKRNSEDTMGQSNKKQKFN